HRTGDLDNLAGVELAGELARARRRARVENKDPPGRLEAGMLRLVDRDGVVKGDEERGAGLAAGRQGAVAGGRVGGVNEVRPLAADGSCEEGRKDGERRDRVEAEAR